MHKILTKHLRKSFGDKYWDNNLRVVIYFIWLIIIFLEDAPITLSGFQGGPLTQIKYNY